MLAVLSTVLGVAGCEEQTDALGSVASPRDSAVASYERWAGDLASHQAAEVVVAHRLNGAWATCMQDRGYDASWQVAIAAPSVVDPLAASLWLTELGAAPYSVSFQLSAWSDRQQARLGRPLPEAERAAAVECREVTEAAGDDEVDAIREPPALTSLTRDWERALAPLAERFGGPDTYLACLDVQDIPALEGKGWRAIDEVFTAARPDPEDIPMHGDSPSPEWKRYLELERPLIEADRACRSAEYDQVQSELPAIVEAFDQEHADRIAELQAHWSEVEGEATTLGWSEERPQAELTP